MGKYFFKSNQYLASKHGFSLIEVSVVISVAAAAMIGFLSWTQPAISTNASKAIETRNKIQEIQKSIEAFRVRKKRLPCPADPLMRSDGTRSTVTVDSTYTTTTGTTAASDYYVNNFGMEDLDTTQSTVNSKDTRGVDCPVSVGAVPVFALGLDESYMNDAWGRRITYHVAPTLCGADSGVSGSPTSTEITLSEFTGCTDNDYRTKTGNITVSNGTSNITTSAAFVLASHGVSGTGAFLPSGAKLSTSSNANEAENSDGDTDYVKADQSSNFDDIVVFETRNQVESLINRKNIKHLSVADCEANSQALKNITLTENTAMTVITDYTQNSGTKNTGDQVLLGILKRTQDICISYYGTAVTTINGQLWSGPQCPGTHLNTASGVSSPTYNTSDGSCACDSGLWDGNCTTTFSPKKYSGLQLWLDASDSSTLFTDITCQTGPPANNASIKCWQDKSGFSNNAIATSLPNASNISVPTYVTNVQNSRSVLRFNGSGQKLLVDSNALLPLSSTGNSTIFVVSSSAGPADPYGPVLETSNSGNDRLNFFPVFWDANHAYTISWTFGNLFNRGLSTYWGPTTPFGIGEISPYGTVNVWTVNGGNLSQNIWRNGTLVASQTISSDLPDYSSANLFIGGASGSNNYLNGDLGEIIVYNTTLSTTNRQAIESYLKTRWGTP